MLIYFRINRSNGKVIQRYIAKGITGFDAYKESFNPFIVFAIIAFFILITLFSLINIFVFSFIFLILFAIFSFALFKFKIFKNVKIKNGEIFENFIKYNVPIYFAIKNKDCDEFLIIHLYENYIDVFVIAKAFINFSEYKNFVQQKRKGFYIKNCKNTLFVRNFECNMSNTIFYNLYTLRNFYELFLYRKDFKKIFNQAEKEVISELKKYSIILK